MRVVVSKCAGIVLMFCRVIVVCLCLVCSLLQFLVLCFVLSVVLVCLFLYVEIVSLCWLHLVDERTFSIGRFRCSVVYCVC